MISQFALLLLSLFAGIAAVAPARAASVVNLCARADQAGAGTNLDTALNAGGQITFSCPAGSSIVIDQPADLLLPVTIDGNGTMTLQVNATDIAFIAEGTRLQLSNLGVTCGPGALNNGLIFGDGVLGLDHVTITNCARLFHVWESAITVETATLQNSALGLLNLGAPQSPIRGIDPVPFIPSSVSLRHITATGLALGAPHFLHFRSNQLTVADVTLKQAGQSIFAFASAGITGLSVSGAQASGTKDSAEDSDEPDGASGGALSLFCLHGTPCKATVAQSAFSGNSAAIGGGAIYAQSVNLSITDTQFNGNTAQGYGGALYYEYGTDVTLQPGLQLARTTFKANTAQAGGALGFFGATAANPVVARAVAFLENRASVSGGAISGVGTIEVVRGDLLGNSAAEGGGVSSDGSTFSLIADSVVGNNTTTSGDGALDGAYRLINASIVGNKGGGIGSGVTVAANTLFTGNEPFNCKAAVTDQSHNLQFGRADCGAGMAQGNPLLNAQFAPSRSGPAADAADPHVCAAAPVDGIDLYGSARDPSGCSIGAVEARPAPPPTADPSAQTGFRLIEVLGLATLLYLLTALALLLIGKNAAGRRALRYALTAIALFCVALLAWWLMRGSPAVALVGDLVWPCLLLFAIGCWRIARNARKTKANAHS